MIDVWRVHRLSFACHGAFQIFSGDYYAYYFVATRLRRCRYFFDVRLMLPAISSPFAT